MMESMLTIPDNDMYKLAVSSLNYANAYYTTFGKSVENSNSRFNNELLYQMAVMSLEKYFVALLACYDRMASHHMPVAMYKEAQLFEPELTDEMKQTVTLAGKFEAICSMSDFGYKAPEREDLKLINKGIYNIRMLVEKRVAEIAAEAF